MYHLYLSGDGKSAIGLPRGSVGVAAWLGATLRRFWGRGPRTTEGCRDESSLVPFISTHSPISTSTVIPFDTLSHSPTYRKEPLSTQGHP
ncbi:hypothetical protein JTE90_011041 [Oedothorax gibbosus]|uniref:Uncharacterized protein n=1 Tax=Oedothorax gibbosus TaxID=931172 RepID=A0AAV6VEI0_9ARAC|nr:hypothetical protein JTE90_011041 [Oedothorax gibbosus]